MCANKKALPYLPKGANLQSLTWGQFAQWAANLQKKFGTPEVGFPVGRPLPALPRGLPRPVVHRTAGDEVREQGRRRCLALPEEPLAVRQPAVDAIRIHAGPAAVRRGSRGLGSRRPPHECPAGEARRLRPLPGSSGPEGSRLHARPRHRRHPEDGAEPDRRQGADRVPRQRQPAGADDYRARLLPGDRLEALEATRTRLARPGGGGEGAAVAEGRACIGAADRPRGAGGSLRQGLHRQLHPDGDEQRRSDDGAEGRGQPAPGPADRRRRPCWAPDPKSTGVCQVG